MFGSFLFGALIGSSIAKNNCSKKPRLMGRDVALSRISRKNSDDGKVALQIYSALDAVRESPHNKALALAFVISCIVSGLSMLVYYLGFLPKPPFYPLYEWTYGAVGFMVLLFIPLFASMLKPNVGMVEALESLILNPQNRPVLELIGRYDPYSHQKVTAFMK